MKAQAGAVLGSVFALGLAACAYEPTDSSFTTAALPPNAKIGEYQPGSTLGTFIDPDSDAGRFSMEELLRAEMRERGGGDPCRTPEPELGLSEDEVRKAEIDRADVSMRPRTRATLTGTFSTKQPGGMWKPANTLAVWIEDIEKRPVKRLEEWPGQGTRWLPTLQVYFDRTCRQDLDVVARATRKDHGGAESFAWTTIDFQNHVVPDGTYVLMIELNDADRTFGPRTEFRIPKGTVPFAMDVPESAATLPFTIVYTPTATTAPPGPSQPAPAPAP